MPFHECGLKTWIVLSGQKETEREGIPECESPKSPQLPRCHLCGPEMPWHHPASVGRRGFPASATGIVDPTTFPPYEHAFDAETLRVCRRYIDTAHDLA